MAFTDFLFNGSPPPAVTTETNAQGSMPLWYSQYAQALTNQASAIAGEPYQAYGGARVADFTQPQQQAFQYVTQNAQNWEPTMQQAAQAGAAGAQPFSQAGLQQFMSPYMSGVTDEIARLGNLNFQQNVAPDIQSAFVGSGQFGSTRNMDIYGQQMQNTQREILGAQSQALQSGFQNAMQNYGNWQDRMRNASQQLGGLAQTQQQLVPQTAAAMETVGAEQQALGQKSLDLAYNDFLEQRDYPRTNVAFLNQALRGLQAPTSTATTATAPYSGNMSPSPLAQLASAYGSIRGLGQQQTG